MTHESLTRLNLSFSVILTSTLSCALSFLLLSTQRNSLAFSLGLARTAIDGKEIYNIQHTLVPLQLQA